MTSPVVEQQEPIDTSFCALVRDIRAYIDNFAVPESFFYHYIDQIGYIILTIFVSSFCLSLVHKTAYFMPGMLTVFGSAVFFVIAFFFLIIKEMSYWRWEKEKRAALIGIWIEIEELQKLVRNIIFFNKSKNSVPKYLKIVEEFSLRIRNLEKIENFLSKNIYRKRYEIFFRNPQDFQSIYSHFAHWLLLIQWTVSTALKSNLTLMQKEIVEYTASVASLDPTDPWLAGARDAQVERLEELSRSFERVRIPTSVIQW